MTVDSWELSSRARHGNGTTFLSDETVANRFNATRVAVRSGSVSTTDYDIAWDGSGGSFNWNFDHTRSVRHGSVAHSLGQIVFTIGNVDMEYDLSGLYSMTGDRHIEADVELKGAQSLFSWIQVTAEAGGNESFVVGRNGDGDDADRLDGSPSGTLQAGHTYTLRYDFAIANRHSESDDPATAEGDFHFTISFTKDQCKNKGWEAFGFRNQGECVRFIETGLDSR